MASSGSQLTEPAATTTVIGATDSGIPVKTTSISGMGTNIQIVVVGEVGADCTNHAINRLAEIEDCLSRFRYESELSELNRQRGFRTIVSPLLFQFLATAQQAMAQTGGLFDPTLAAVQRHLGYDRPFDALGGLGEAGPVGLPSESALKQGSDRRFELDLVTRSVLCGHDVQIDLGGIAKGLAADLVSLELIELGATGCCVNVGGDLRVRGHGPKKPDRWDLTISLPLKAGGKRNHRQRVSLSGGAVCTSSVLKRAWPVPGGSAHHILDPWTRSSSCSDLHSVSVIARTAAAAEVLATVSLIEGAKASARRMKLAEATAIQACADGSVLTLPGLERFTLQPANENTFGGSVPASTMTEPGSTLPGPRYGVRSNA